MYQIYRKEIKLGVPFEGPENITIGYQPQRDAFSMWYVNQAPVTKTYVVIGTGHETDTSIEKLRQTIIMPDGFTVFHLVEL